jgi:hypothetical protein
VYRIKKLKKRPRSKDFRPIEREREGKEITTKSTLNRIDEYRQNWINHLNRTTNDMATDSTDSLEEIRKNHPII